jgi:hypothetical protein
VKLRKTKAVISHYTRRRPNKGKAYMSCDHPPPQLALNPWVIEAICLEVLLSCSSD